MHQPDSLPSSRYLPCDDQIHNNLLVWNVRLGVTQERWVSDLPKSPTIVVIINTVYLTSEKKVRNSNNRSVRRKKNTIDAAISMSSLCMAFRIIQPLNNLYRTRTSAMKHKIPVTIMKVGPLLGTE